MNVKGGEKTKSKKLLISILILLSVLVSIGCVAAQETNSTDLTVQDPTDDAISPLSETQEVEISETSNDLEDLGNDTAKLSTSKNTNSDDKLATANNDEPLSISPEGHTFIDIERAVELAALGGVIDLERGITYTGSNSINVHHSVTINGNGAILDARGIPLIFRIHESNVTIKNITFINCRAILDGGAIYWSGKNGMLVNCTFKDNKATLLDGGALYWTGDNGKIVNCTFINNSAYLNGGAIYLKANNCTIENCNFTNNTANDGGAVYLLRSNCKIDNCDFTENNASGSGGAIYCYSDLLTDLLIPRENNTISNCNFTDNTANYNGGAVYLGTGYSNITNCFFDSNSAYYDGGAVYLKASNCKIDKSGFTNNNASSSGGAVYCSEVFSRINNMISECIFTDNTADEGGALYIMESYITLDLDYFNNNVAAKGSAIYINRASEFINISNTEFGRNTAECMMVFIGGIDGNETYALANVTVDAYLIGRDNIANAIWNNGETTSVQLYNITCEFSKDGKGRSLKKFNMEGFANPTDGFEIESKIWQSSLENAQLIDILVTDENGNVVLNITNGIDSTPGKSENGATPSDDTNLIVTDTIGKISVTIENLKAGKYTVLAKHKDDQYYTADEDSDTFVIYEKIATHISVENVTAYPGMNVTIHINVTTDDNKAFSGNVTIEFPDGSNQTVEIIEGNGKVKWFVLENHDTGIYKDTVRYSGNDIYLASTGNGTITVVPKIAIDIVVSNETAYPDSDVTVSINVTADDGTPFNGEVKVIMPDGSTKPVKIVDGVASTALQLSRFNLLSAKASTIGTGTADWHVPASFAPGNYSVSVEFDGNDKYLAANGSGNIEVIPIPTDTKVSNVTGKAGKNVVIPIKVTSDNNKPFNGIVSVTLPDGSTKTAKIVDGSGKVSWPIPKNYEGTYKFTVNYPGNDTFLPSNDTGFITVIPDDTPADDDSVTPNDSPVDEIDKTPVEKSTETQQKDVKTKNKSLSKNETGNPILVLIAVLALLCVSIKRKK